MCGNPGDGGARMRGWAPAWLLLESHLPSLQTADRDGNTVRIIRDEPAPDGTAGPSA